MWGMKIAIVTHNLSSITGGPRLIFGLAEHLKGLGQEVVIYAPDVHPHTQETVAVRPWRNEKNSSRETRNERHQTSKGVGIHDEYFREISEGIRIEVVRPRRSPRSAEKPGGFWKWIFGKIQQELYDIDFAKMAGEAMDPDFDIINVHDFCYRAGYFYKKRNPKTKVVWNENAPPFEYLKRGKFLYDMAGFFYGLLKKFTNRKYLKAIDSVIVLDHFNEQWSRAHGFKNIVVVRAGIDFKKFYAPVKNFKEKASRKAAQLLAVGALNAFRRYDNVIDAMRLLREWGYDARAVIVANNIWHEDKCRNDLQAMVEKYNLKPYVEFYFDGMPEDNLIKTFQGSDIFIQAVYSPPPSHHGWGLVNFEAMAAGVPVVLVRSATATEVLKEGENALFFDPLQSDQIAEKVKFLIDHPEEYARIAKAGQTYVKENQSWKKYSEEMLVVFQKA